MTPAQEVYAARMRENLTPSTRSSRGLEAGRPKRVAELIRQAAALFGIQPGCIVAKSNEPLPVRARKFVMTELQQAGYSSGQIGKWLGGKHHTTVLYHLKRPYSKPAPPEPWKADTPDYSGEWAI